MTVRVKNILDSLNSIAPFHLAEPWDNVGLLVGDREQKVSGVLVGLDTTSTLVDEAVAIGANTIITHHPVIFKPLPAINTGNSTGKLLQKILANHLVIIGYHTNFDSAAEGVSDALAKMLGLKNLIPLLPSPDENSTTGLGKIGTLEPPLKGDLFVADLCRALDINHCQITSTPPKKIAKVAVCGGSGSDLSERAFAAGADIYLSAEIKHSTAVWAAENNFCIIDGSHYATEKPAMTLLVKKLNRAGNADNWNIEITQTQKEKHPFTGIALKPQT